MISFKELRENINEKVKKLIPSKFDDDLLLKAFKIALDMGGNMTGAYKKIEKMKRGLGDDKYVKYALRLANESVDEKMSDKDKKKRLDLIKKAVERLQKKNDDAAKKDAMKMMKQSGMFDE